MNIEIEVYYHSDETLKLKNTGMKYSVLECDTRMATFYNIDAISSWEDEESGEWLCEIFTGERSFISIKTYEEIKKILSEYK